VAFFNLFKKKYETVSPAAAKELQSAGAMLIDVRESHEYRAGHAPGAKHIALSVLARRLSEVPKEREILVICASGMRSQQAANLLSAEGFNVKNVNGGMALWQRSGLTVVK
jgi:rhodanese-related sulfurtransferase